MKTIEEEAKEFSEKVSNGKHHRDLICGFEAGANRVQQWILMSYELPAIGVEIILKSAKTKIIKTPKSHDEVHWCAENFTHWRPLERK